ncbi:MAG TPA: ABC transporter substrate-binding protein [Acetobacteraceae bacterium]|nr:ABC transporter substrate-binding protein [Acetobacteraceae bacterium]
MVDLTRRNALALGAAVTLGARRAFALSAKPAPLDPPVTLRLGENTVPHVCPLVDIAAELKPLGVNVETAKFARYADTRTALASGSIDAGSIGPADVAIALSQGLDTIVALMGVGISAKYPMAKPGLTLTKWDDLIGPRIGIAPGSAVWFQFAAMLTEEGVPYGKLTTVNIQGAGTSFLIAMKRGDIDVFIGWEPFESQAVLEGLATRQTALDYSKSKAVGAELGLIAVNAGYLKRQPEAVKRFVWAYIAVQDRLKASQAAEADAIARFTGLPPDVAKSVAAVTNLGQYLTLDQMQRQAAAFAKFGVLTKDVSAELPQYFDQKLVASVQS